MSDGEGSERVVLGWREDSMVGFKWSGLEPEGLYDLQLAEEMGAIWEGDELVTYDMDSLRWQTEHVGDEYTIDND